VHQNVFLFPRVLFFQIWLFSGLTPCFAQSIIPKEALAGKLTKYHHLHADIINTFLTNQDAFTPESSNTGLTRADYLPVIASIVKGIAGNESNINK
jgi:hypothetical protein